MPCSGGVRGALTGDNSFLDGAGIHDLIRSSVVTGVCFGDDMFTTSVYKWSDYP